MSAYTPYVEASAVRGELPRQVRVVRILLGLGAAFTVLVVVGFLAVAGWSAETLGQAVWGAWPGVVAACLVRSLPRGGRRRYWLVVVVSVFWLLGALSEVGSGQARGLTQALLPIALLVLHLQRPSREFYRE